MNWLYMTVRMKTIDNSNSLKANASSYIQLITMTDKISTFSKLYLFTDVKYNQSTIKLDDAVCYFMTIIKINRNNNLVGSGFLCG